VYGEYGNASRSLMAVHELYQAGFTNVAHVDGGFAQWKSQKLPVKLP
jgi:rhodanese-related sulfurtransferase